MGGAAGPGKTTAALMELFVACNEFNSSDGPKVQTLALRRTYPKLEKTVLTRARELFPSSLYKRFTEAPGKAFIEWQTHGAFRVNGLSRMQTYKDKSVICFR